MEIPGRKGGLMRNSLHGGGMDIFWNYTIDLYPEEWDLREKPFVGNVSIFSLTT